MSLSKKSAKLTKSDKPSELPKALKDYVRLNCAKQSMEKLCANTGLSQEQIHSYLKSIYEKMNVKETTEVGLCLTLEKGNSVLQPTWFISESCGIESLYGYIKTLRDFSFNLIVLENLKQHINAIGGKTKILVDQMFPEGIVGTQSVADPLLTLGDDSNYI